MENTADRGEMTATISVGGKTADITHLIRSNGMATTTETATAMVEEQIHARLEELMPDLVRYVAASKEAGKITMAIALTPDKKTDGAFWVSVIPSLNVKGIAAEGPATLEWVDDDTMQLRIAGMDLR